MNNQTIEFVKDYKFLRIILQNNLSWNLQTNKIIKILSRNLGIITRVAYFLPKRTLITLYYAFIFSHLNYCNIIWINSTKSNLNKLRRIQNRCIKIISKHDTIEREELYKKYKILPIEKLYKYNVLITMYKRIKENKYSEIIDVNRYTHNYITRNKD